MAWGRRVCIFSFYDWGWAVWSGQVEAWVVLSVAWSASCSLLVRRAQVVILYVCYEWRICSVWQVVNQMETFERDKLRENVWMVAHMSLSERRKLFPSSGGWFEERRGGSRVVTNPTVWVRDRRVSIIDYGYRWRVSGIEFSSLMFATNSRFVRFDNVVNRMETFERETTYE